MLLKKVGNARMLTNNFGGKGANHIRPPPPKPSASSGYNPNWRYTGIPRHSSSTAEEKQTDSTAEEKQTEDS